MSEKLPYGDFRAFQIHDPKKRLIHAACFEDRVFHHALMNIIGESLEKRMQYSSFACRKDKGVHRAAESVQQNLRKFPKPSVQIQKSSWGVSYCGFRILSGAMRLSRRRKRRYHQRRVYWEQEYMKGNINAVQLQQSYAAVHAMTEKTDSAAWRCESLRRHPPIGV